VFNPRRSRLTQRTTDTALRVASLVFARRERLRPLGSTRNQPTSKNWLGDMNVDKLIKGGKSGQTHDLGLGVSTKKGKAKHSDLFQKKEQ